MDKKKLHPQTLAVRAGINRTPEGEHSLPIFATSSYIFEDAAQAAARFGGEEPGNIYSRFTNPTTKGLADKLTALEGAQWCEVFASGMAAVTAVFLAHLHAGDHVVASRSVFGTIAVLLEKHLPQWGIEVTLVDLVDINDWEQAIRPNTKVFFLETPSNPLTQIANLRELADLAHANGALLAVDNCFCTPALQTPLDFGADLVVHSATKYLDGQGRCIGGAMLGNDPALQEAAHGYLKTAGPCISPFNAWTIFKGIETLGVRMAAHCANAATVAHWLEEHPRVNKVFYPGLASHPQHELAKVQQNDFGGIVSFEIAGGKDTAWNVIDNTELMSITGNLGDVKTIITHPATTTHGRMQAETRAKAGITDGVIRLAVGLEHVDDILADLEQAIAKTA